MNSVLVGLIYFVGIIMLFAFVASISYGIISAFVYGICWAFSYPFSWKLSFGIWLVMILLGQIFRTKK
jgi:hypothetical protein